MKRLRQSQVISGVLLQHLVIMIFKLNKINALKYFKVVDKGPKMYNVWQIQLIKCWESI